MLASSTVVGDFAGLLTRRVGRFRLVGKADAIDVHELLALRDEATPEQHSLADQHGFTWNFAGRTRPQLWRSMTPQ